MRSRITDGWATGLVRVGPLPGDQAAVPGQQRGTSDDSMGPQPAGEQAGQGGQDRSVWPTQARPGHLTTQHRDFVTQDEDLGQNFEAIQRLVAFGRTHE